MSEEKVKGQWATHWRERGSLEETATLIGRWLRNKRLALLRNVLKDLDRSSTVIDLGCGGGITLRLFKELGFTNSVGIDFTEYAIQRCQDIGLNFNKDVFLMDAKRTTFQIGSFDIVFSEGLWEHFLDPRPYMLEAVRLSRRYIIVIQPNHYSFFGKLMQLGWRIYSKNKGGVKEYSFLISYFRDFLKLYGFTLIKSESTIFREQSIMVFERNAEWSKAQELESYYSQKLEDQIWKIPRSLEYWTNFLLLEDIKGQGLEVGCGNHGLYNFTENVVGLDPINFHKRNFIKSVGEHLPIKNVDFVVCCNGIDHCKDPRKVLEEMFRVTNKVVLWVWVHPRLVSWFMKKIDKMHPYHLTKKKLEGLLDNFSVKVTKKKVYTTFWHWKYTDNWKVRTKLLFAYILGVRGLCLHLERESWT